MIHNKEIRNKYDPLEKLELNIMKLFGIGYVGVSGALAFMLFQNPNIHNLGAKELSYPITIILGHTAIGLMALFAGEKKKSGHPIKIKKV